MFVGSADPRGRVHKHHPNGTVLSTIQLDSASSPHGSPWLALNNAQTRVLSTRHGQQLQQYDLTSRAILPALQADKTAGGQCFGLQALDDGSVLVACKACVHQVWQAAPTTIRFCASNATSEAHASNATAVAKELKMLALDPTGAAFYVADAAQALVRRPIFRGLCRFCAASAFTCACSLTLPHCRCKTPHTNTTPPTGVQGSNAGCCHAAARPDCAEWHAQDSQPDRHAASGPTARCCFAAHCQLGRAGSSACKATRQRHDRGTPQARALRRGQTCVHADAPSGQV